MSLRLPHLSPVALHSHHSVPCPGRGSSEYYRRGRDRCLSWSLLVPRGALVLAPPWDPVPGPEALGDLPGLHEQLSVPLRSHLPGAPFRKPIRKTGETHSLDLMVVQVCQHLSRCQGLL